MDSHGIGGVEINCVYPLDLPAPADCEAVLYPRMVRELRDFVRANGAQDLIFHSYDLGESARVVLLSVTEGEDKPLKYPVMFQSAQIVVINKMDIAEAVGFDRETALRNIRRVAPDATIFEVSARTGDGMQRWYDLLCSRLRA